MVRRDIFNIFFGNAATSSETLETVAIIDTPSYLKVESTIPLIQEFVNLHPGQDISLKVSTSHAFSISWSPASNLLFGTSLHLGIKPPQEPEYSGVLLGLHADACLYIGEVLDNRKLTLEKLSQGFRLKLDVNPQAGEPTYAKLTLTDNNGLTLAMAKNKEYENTTWEGTIIVAGQHLKYLKIEGRVHI